MPVVPVVDKKERSAWRSLTMKRLLSIFAVVFVVVIGCQSTDSETAVEPRTTQPPPAEEPPPTAVPPTETAPPPTEEPQAADFSELEQALQAVVDAQVEAGFPGAILMVDAPDLGFSWKGAAGLADSEGEIPLEAGMPIRLGGITNLMTASVILRLAEEGQIDLDAAIGQYLDEEITAQLDGPNGEPYGEKITVRQLLNHTSGVASYFYAEDRDLNGLNDFEDVFLDDPEKLWEPEETITFTVDNVDPAFAPGESWSYSDLNGVLLGLIIEAVTGESLENAYQEWLFEPSGMEDTYLALVGDPRLDSVSHVHYYGLDVTGYPSLSWQWGGNGVVSTVEDLNHFMWALLDGRIFSSAESLDAMTEWTSMASAGFDGLSYGLGIIQVDFGEFGMPEIGKIQGHNSNWNGFIYYWPQYNIVFSGTLNESMPMDGYTSLAMSTMQTMLPYVTEG
jgi:D-alanyl-D-alanine carboxypeptidase